MVANLYPLFKNITLEPFDVLCKNQVFNVIPRVWRERHGVGGCTRNKYTHSNAIFLIRATV